MLLISLLKENSPIIHVYVRKWKFVNYYIFLNVDKRVYNYFKNRRFPNLRTFPGIALFVGEELPDVDGVSVSVDDLWLH